MSERFDDAPRLGPGTSFDGVLSFDGALRVDGLVAGTVQAEAGCLIVGAQGRVNARVAVGELVLAGVLIGDVIAQRRVELLPGAQLEGNVTAPLLAIAEGGRILGRLSTGAQALASAPKSS